MVNSGTDPKWVVPDNYYVVRGGTAPMEAVGIKFSASVGPSLDDAAAAVP
jgi:hypothetical protein